MKCTIYEEELRQAGLEIVTSKTENASYVGLKISLTDLDQVTLWFASKADMDEWLTTVMWKAQQSGVN
jgi:hypothetical protein